MQPIRVWFNKSFAGTFNVVQAIRLEGDVFALASHTNEDFAAQSVADKAFLEPKGLLGEAYLAYCLETCKRYAVDVFVPGKEVSLIAAHSETFAALGTQILCAAPSQTLRLIANKAEFYRALEEENTTARPPAWRPFQTLEEFERGIVELQEKSERHATRLCFKPNLGVYGSGFRLIEDGDDFERLFEIRQQKISYAAARTLFGSRDQFPTMLLMHYADGCERSIDALAWQGTLVQAVVRRKQPGEGRAQVIEEGRKLCEMADAIARQFQLRGLFNLQTRDLNDQSLVLEVNARISGGMHISLESELNLPLWAVRLLVGRARPEDVPAPRVGRRVNQVSTACALEFHLENDPAKRPAPSVTAAR